jgi:hypothetical protein
MIFDPNNPSSRDRMINLGRLIATDCILRDNSRFSIFE